MPLQPRSLFVTGTDTGVGKTVVACGLVRALQLQGLRVAAMKPVASGSAPTPAGLRNDDALALQALTGADYELINPIAYEPPIAPHLAAAASGRAIDLDAIGAAARRLAAGADWLVVEGAGGWRVPLGDTRSMVDLVRALDLPVVLVVGIRLGCINHALLSVEAIIADQRPLLGWVANILDADDGDPAGQVATLRQRISAPLLGQLPPMDDPTPDAVATRLDLGPLLDSCGG